MCKHTKIRMLVSKLKGKKREAMINKLLLNPELIGFRLHHRIVRAK